MLRLPSSGFLAAKTLPGYSSGAHSAACEALLVPAIVYQVGGCYRLWLAGWPSFQRASSVSLVARQPLTPSSTVRGQCIAPLAGFWVGSHMTTYLYESAALLGKGAPAVCQRSTSTGQVPRRAAATFCQALFWGCHLFFPFSCRNASAPPTLFFAEDRSNGKKTDH